MASLLPKLLNETSTGKILKYFLYPGRVVGNCVRVRVCVEGGGGGDLRVLLLGALLLGIHMLRRALLLLVNRLQRLRLGGQLSRILRGRLVSRVGPGTETKWNNLVAVRCSCQFGGIG